MSVLMFARRGLQQDAVLPLAQSYTWAFCESDAAMLDRAARILHRHHSSRMM